MDDEDSRSDLAKKRTARVQLANGAMEARAYVAPTPVPLDSDHKTIEMRTVAVDEALDPRLKATVARGMGEAMAVLEGEIVDPATGQVIPAVDPRAVPNTPWAHGKRPTHLKGVAPPKIGSAGAGAPVSAPAAYGAYLAAGAIVVAAVVCAGLIISTRGNSTPPAPASAAPTGSSPAARATSPRVLEPAPVPEAILAPPTVTPAESSAPASGGAAAMPPAKVPASAPPGKAAPTPPKPPPPSSAAGNGRIF